MPNNKKSIFDNLYDDSHCLKVPTPDLTKEEFMQALKNLDIYEKKRKKSRLIWLEDEQRIALLTED